MAARTPELKMMFLELSKNWEKLAIQPEDAFAKLSESEDIRSTLEQSLNEKKWLSNFPMGRNSPIRHFETDTTSEGSAGSVSHTATLYRGGGETQAGLEWRPLTITVSTPNTIKWFLSDRWVIAAGESAQITLARVAAPDRGADSSSWRHCLRRLWAAQN